MLATLSPAPRWRSSSTTSAAAAGRADDCPSNPSPRPPPRSGEGEQRGKCGLAPSPRNEESCLSPPPRSGEGVGGRGLSFSRQFPALAIVAAEQFLGLGRVANAHGFGVPFETLAGAVGDVAQVVRLGQQSTVAEVTRRRRAGLASAQPFRVVADRLGNRLFRVFEPREVLFRQ